MLTPKQKRILQALAKAKASHHLMTIDELISEASLSASKQAAQQTLRTLEKKRLLLRRYERKLQRVHLVLEITPNGLALV